MSTTQITEVAPVPGRARGRGGTNRGGGRGGTPTTRALPAVPKDSGKFGPTAPLKGSYVDDSSLKGKSFVILVAGAEGSTQFTFHRPIGETPLDDNRDWVATPSSEVSLLLNRRKSEDLARWERERSVAIRAAVLASSTGRELNNAVPPKEVWTTDGRPECGPRIKTAQAAAKTAARPENEWMMFVPTVVRQSEQRFKDALVSTNATDAWLRDNPRPMFETRGGPLADRRQEAVEYLNGRSLRSAQDLVLRKMLGLVADATIAHNNDDRDE